MKIFEKVQGNLLVLDINTNELNRFNWKISIGFLLLSLSILSNVINFCTIEIITLVDCMVSFCVITAATVVGICFAAIVLKQTKLFKFIGNIEKLINERLKYASSSEAIYERTNELVEKISGISYVVFVKVMPQCIIWPIFVMSFIKYFSTDLNDAAFVLPIPFWRPFNWHGPFGYSFAIAWQWTLLTNLFFTPIMILLIIGIGSYLFIIAVTKDIKCILKTIDKNSKSKKLRKQYYEKIIEFIDLHSDIKQIVSDFSNLYQPLQVVLFIQGLLTLSCAMLIIQMELSHYNHGNNTLDIILMELNACNTFGIVFTSCELGQRLNDAFSEVKGLFDQFQWYRFPIQVKRILPIVLIVAQKPVSIECFGSISCCRDSFKKILNGAYSYFMVLRKFIE